MHVQTALRAVERERIELAPEIGLHLEQSSRSIVAWVTSGLERPCPTSIASSTSASALAACSRDVDGVLEDLALSAGHGWPSRAPLARVSPVYPRGAPCGAGDGA